MMMGLVISPNHFQARIRRQPQVREYLRSDYRIVEGGTGRGLVRGGLLLADGGAERVHQVLPGAIVAPLREVCLDCALGQQIVWEHVPLAACTVEVK